MSTEEQMAAIGRLVTERAEVRRNATLLHASIVSLAESIQSGAHRFTGHSIAATPDDLRALNTAMKPAGLKS
jgi:hypothetical protein